MFILSFYIFEFDVEITQENAELLITERLELWISFVPYQPLWGQISKCFSGKCSSISEKLKCHYSCGESVRFSCLTSVFGKKKWKFYDNSGRLPFNRITKRCLFHVKLYLLTRSSHFLLVLYHNFSCLSIKRNESIELKNLKQIRRLKVSSWHRWFFPDKNWNLGFLYIHSCF